MSEKYTKGPWSFGDVSPDGSLLIVSGKRRRYVANVQVHQAPRAAGAFEEMERKANARRIVACVNACDGISTDELEEISRTGGMLGPREDVARTAKQRDELLEALEEMVRTFDKNHAPALDVARAAIAKATGEQG